jgi:hypothetical protein
VFGPTLPFFFAMVGPDPAMVGPDPATGVTFVDTTTTPIRHLGVLLSARGATAFAEQLFQQRLASITNRTRLWSRYELTLLAGVRWPGKC